MTDLLAGAEIAAYRIEAIAGRGGMGVVYRATDLTLERLVALKVISDEFAQDVGFRERFKRESRLAASIRHPNVITVFRAGEEGGRLYIAMDFIEGTDLKALIRQHGRLEPGLAADIVYQVAGALDAAHAKTLVHRDIKPANVLIAGEGDSLHAYLTDFGLTKHTASQSAMTETGMVVGTIDYMAPEQISGDRLDARTDVYSLGCVLYEALTGEVPYPKESNVAKMFAHSSESPPSVAATAPDVAPGFDAIVSRSMAKDADQRYPSAGDLGRAARAAAEGTSVAQTERSVAAGEAAAPTALAQGAPPRRGATRPATPSTRAPRRRRSLVLAAAALLAAAIVAAVLLAGGSGDERPAGLSKDQYQDRLLDANRPFTREASLMDERLPAHVLKERDALKAAAQLSTLRKTTDRLIGRLEQISPPADVADLHRRVIAVFKRIRGDIADAGAAADFGNDRIYRSTPAKLDTDFEALAQLGPAFAARGYKRLSF